MYFVHPCDAPPALRNQKEPGRLNPRSKEPLRNKNWEMKRLEVKEERAVRPSRLPGIGLRNIKTAISATLCVLIYAITGRNPTFACIGAVFGMDNSLPSSWRTGGNRLVGTVIGGFLGMGLFYVSLLLPFEAVRVALLFGGIVLLIYLSQLLRFAGAVQAGAVVFYIVMLNTPEDQYVSYALNRMFDTGFGVVMSLFINWVHFRWPLRAKPPTDRE